MNRRLSWWIMTSIFIVFFDIIFFLLVDSVSDIQWVSFGFLHIAYLFFVPINQYLRSREKSIVLSYPITFLSTVYFVTTFALSSFLMIFELASVKVSFILHFIILGVYLILLLKNLIMNQRTTEATESQQGSIDFVKSNVALLEQFKLSLSAKTDLAQIDKVIEQLKYGQMVTNGKTDQLDQSISHLIMQLDNGSDDAIYEKLTNIEGLINRREISLR